MLRKSAFILSLLLFTLSSKSQVYNPVRWDYTFERTGDRQFDLIFTASIEDKWHIYAMDIPSGGPIPTSFRFDTVPGYKLIGKTYEVTKPSDELDEAFGFRIKTFSKTAEFRQKISADDPSFTVKGSVNYMACNNVTCLPPKDADFELKIGDQTAGKSVPAPKAGIRGLTGQSSTRNLLSFFIISLLAGFAGVLTPCVFPVIPMTVAFFSRGSENRRRSVYKALIFGLSIILIYSSLGIIVSLTSAGSGFANTLSTHWIPNLIFFLLFIFFAVSFFGAFEIVLPDKWISTADSRADKGGLLGSFFMGLTTVIISFSCTGPIIGALLVEAAGGHVLRPTIGMFGFGLAFSLPFTAFALFPSLMSRMPKSGGWLNSVKVVLGFIMLAFSMKFFMTIDSVYNLGILSRDLFIAIWIVLFSLLGFYLMGRIRFVHDSELKHIGTLRLFLIITVFSFVVYLIPGLFGAPLKAIASFLPSQTTTGLNLPRLLSEGRQYQIAPSQNNEISKLCSEPRFADIFEMPLGLSGYFEYKQGLKCAKEQNKPVLFDFKGHACANCKLMEARVWSNPEILNRLRENFVIVALYVDDRTQLPENEWIKSGIDGKIKKSIGKINEDLEISKFKTNALPLYVITGFDGNPLNPPMPTNLNIEEYKRWLDEGLEVFKNK